MFCMKCGQEIPDNASVCEHCGQPTQQAAQQPEYQPTYYTEQPSEYQTAPPAKQQMPMKWFKFLIYFALFAGPILNFINGFSMLTGAQYGADAEMVYAVIKGLRFFDILCGVILIGLAVFGIITRFQLSGYKYHGPRMLTILYAGIAVYDLIYIVGLNIIMPDAVLAQLDFASTYGALAGSVVFIFVNHIYFKKRSHLFYK